MLTFNDDEVKAQISEEVGFRPALSLESSHDEVIDVQHSIARLRANPIIANKDHIRGFVFNVRTGRREEVHI